MLRCQSGYGLHEIGTLNGFTTFNIQKVMQRKLRVFESPPQHSNMEDLSKFLPLYLGQKIRSKPKDFRSWEWPFVDLTPELLCKILTDISYEDFEWQLQLRPLSSMTEEEGKALDCMGWETRWDKNGVPHTLFQPEAFIKLIEWGFDIFRLKEKGLCIYENEL